MYSFYHSWTPPLGAKIQQPGHHWAAYREHLKAQATAASHLAQAELYAPSSHNTHYQQECDQLVLQQNWLLRNISHCHEYVFFSFWCNCWLPSFHLNSQIVLHPCHKLAYFKAQGWEEAWIDTAHNIICDEYVCSYVLVHLDGHCSSDDDYTAVGSVDSVSVHILSSAYFSDLLPPQLISSSNNIFDNLPDLSPASPDLFDELELYLSTDTEDVKDAISWWYERHASFPYLSCMAWDYLSIPGK